MTGWFSRRKGRERVYDLRERLVPAPWAHVASEEEVGVEALFEGEVLRASRIVSARGRPLFLFVGFAYLSEVEKPQEKRRWGSSTWPILSQDTLVARADLKRARETRRLVVKGF